MTAPLPVCSAKLSIVGPGQYYGGGPRWNPGCCSFAFASFSLLLPNFSFSQHCLQTQNFTLIFFAALLKSKSEVPYQFQFQALGFFTPVLLLITNHTLTPCAIVGIQEANVILVAITTYLTHQFLNFYCLYLCYHPFFVCLTNQKDNKYKKKRKAHFWKFSKSYNPNASLVPS